jgi:hypothetical protein
VLDSLIQDDRLVFVEMPRGHNSLAVRNSLDLVFGRLPVTA